MTLEKRGFFPADLLKGKTAFITGGGSGINLGIGKRFAELGANLAICGRTAEKLEAAAKEIHAVGGGKVSTSVADVRSLPALEAALAKSKEELGSCDILVCGAAGNFLANVESLSSNGWKAVMEIDLLGSFHAVRAAFEQLKETKGNVLFLGAGQSWLPFAGQTHVGAAKAGNDALMRGIAVEWGKYGIRANTVIPGPIEDTEGMRRLGDGDAGQVWRNQVPLGRYGKIEEVADMAVVLCSPLSAYVTGAMVTVDGGLALSGAGGFNLALAASLPASKK